MGLPPGEPPPDALPLGAGQVVIADVAPGRCPAADRSIPHDRPNAITRSSRAPARHGVAGMGMLGEADWVVNGKDRGAGRSDC